MAVKKGGLGRGLESLFNENAADSNGAVTVNLYDVEPNREQPRKDFDESTISELAESISEHGLIQPIVVKPTIDGRYMIIAGERRWRACRVAGLNKIPVIIKDIDERSATELALIENLQREDLNAVEEALGYRSLIDNFGLTQDEVAKKMGKSRSTVTNALRLLSLNEIELDALRNGNITAGHARALLSCDDGELRREMLSSALGGASVRELEKISSTNKNTGKSKKSTERVKSNYYSEVELALKNEMHRKVRINPGGNGRGTLTVEFFSDEELSDFAERLSREPTNKKSREKT